jgi:hypothetical protein
VFWATGYGFILTQARSSKKKKKTGSLSGLTQKPNPLAHLDSKKKGGGGGGGGKPFGPLWVSNLGFPSIKEV